MTGAYLEHFLDHIAPLFTDESVIEININSDGKIFVERAGSQFMSAFEKTFEEKRVNGLINQLQNLTKVEDSKVPLLSGDAHYKNRDTRFQVVRAPAVTKSPAIAFRLYGNAAGDWNNFQPLYGNVSGDHNEKAIVLEKLRAKISKNKIQEAMEIAISERLNIIIAGETSSGKTTFAKLLLGLIDERERLVLIEDAKELRPKHKNKVELIANRNEGSGNHPSRLLEATLRLRPDRIVMGETRGVEAFTFLEAINTGHGGSFTTLHAESPAFARLRLALMVGAAGGKLNHKEILEYIDGTVDVYVQLARKGAKRGVVEIKVTDRH